MYLILKDCKKIENYTFVRKIDKNDNVFIDFFCVDVKNINGVEFYKNVEFIDAFILQDDKILFKNNNLPNNLINNILKNKFNKNVFYKINPLHYFDFKLN